MCPRAFNQRVVLREHIRSHHSAPDANHGNSSTPYYCSLCGDLFAVSLDLIHHLIEHSDRSTAAKRVQPTGPRKYKRRRKINGDSDASDFVLIERDNRQHVTTIKQEFMETIDKTNIFSSIFELPNEKAEFKLPDEIFQATGKRVPVAEKKPATKSTGSRPKMIYTQKTRVADGKRKTKTMIQKRVLQKTKPEAALVRKQEVFEHDESSETWSNDDPNEDVLDTLMKRERKLSEKFTIDLVNDLQDILRSPLKINEEKDDDESPNTRRSRRQVTSRYGSSTLKRPSGKKKMPDPEETDDDDDELQKIIIKQEIEEGELYCEICGDTFETRSQLLNHVPIHI